MKTKTLSFALAAGLLVVASSWGFTYITDQRTDGTPLPLKWPAGSVAIQIKLGTDQTLSDNTNFSTSAQAAAQMWNALLGDLQITSTIAPPSAAAQNNGVNELVFADNDFDQKFDSQTLAVTTTWSIGDQRTQADIVFNSTKTWDSYRGSRRSAVDIRRVALHEMGHLLGLNHPDEAGQTVSAIMNSHISDLDALTTDDITGAQNLYGPPGTPGNDNFANATTITLSNNAATLTGYNTNATKQAGEPNHANTPGGRSVWWKWTAPASGPANLDTRGSYLDTVLGVYTGSAIGSLTAIASNDDLSASPHVQASAVSFTAVGGTTYFIAVDGFFDTDHPSLGADSAGITLNLSHTPTGPTVPAITTQPVGATVTAGGSVTFSVVATDASSYQWQFNGTNIGGATSASYSISNVTASQAGSYRVTVSNNAGSVNSDQVTLTVNTPAPPPTPPSSGGGGGGGAPSLWFYGALSLLAASRILRHRHALGA